MKNIAESNPLISSFLMVASINNLKRNSEKKNSPGGGPLKRKELFGGFTVFKLLGII